MQADPHDFIGRGFDWPLTVDSTGSLALIGGAEVLEQSIRSIIGTAKGERVMRPEFGCAIWELIFAPITTNNLGLMEHAVRDALGQWEPRITVEDVTATQDRSGSESTVHIAVTYAIRATNDIRNLVFPFYVIPGEKDSR